MTVMTNLAVNENIKVENNQFYLVLRRLDVLPNFCLTTSETRCDY